MKRLFLTFVLTIGTLSAFADPVIGRSLGGEVRVRALPDAEGAIAGALGLGDEVIVLGRGEAKTVIDGKKAYWLYVAGYNGLLGWTFGGYLNTGGVELATLDAVEGLDLFFDAKPVLNGAATVIRASTPQGSFTGLVLKEAGRPAAFLIAEFIPYPIEEDLDIDEVTAADICGDSRREILVSCWTSVVDSAEVWMRIYGLLPGKQRYAPLGRFYIGYGSAGSEAPHYARLVRGPESAIEGGRRVVKLVLEAVDGQPDTSWTEGSLRLVITTVTTEYSYALEDGSFVALGSRELDRKVEPGALP